MDPLPCLFLLLFLTLKISLNKNQRILLIADAFLIGMSSKSFVQGSAGIDSATSSLTAYVDPVYTLILAIGAVVGLFGGCRVSITWNSGQNDINTASISWA